MEVRPQDGHKFSPEHHHSLKVPFPPLPLLSMVERKVVFLLASGALALGGVAVLDSARQLPWSYFFALGVFFLYFTVVFARAYRGARQNEAESQGEGEEERALQGPEPDDYV